MLEIMEEKFGKDISETEIPRLTLRFSSSRVDGEYRATNALMVDDDLGAARPNYRRMFRTLLNSAPPTADVLVDEGSGCGLFKVFLAKTTAHYSTLVTTQADRTFLNGLEDNILRLSSDFFLANFMLGYINIDGEITPATEQRLRTDLDAMRTLYPHPPLVPEANNVARAVKTIPTSLVPNILSMVEYVLEGVFHLNKFAGDVAEEGPDENIIMRMRRKRKAIVLKLSEGEGRAGQKKRKVYFSRLYRRCADMTKEELRAQITILVNAVIVNQPTYQSISLERRLSITARLFLREECSLNDTEIDALIAANANLLD